MKPPQTYRFQAQNYPDSPDWFRRFLSDINNFSEPLWNMVNKNITIQDNIDAQIFTFTIVAGATETDNTVDFSSTLKHTPQTVVVGQAQSTSPYASPLTGVSLSWTYDNPNISVNAIAGLTSGQEYQITLRVE